MAKRKRTTLTESSTFVVQHAYGLLALPAELRNRIWEYALSDLEVEIPRRSSVNRRGGKYRDALTAETSRTLALTRLATSHLRPGTPPCMQANIS